MEEAGDHLNASSRKRSRPSEAAEDDEDHISPLPDHIILHVLSFLDVRDVVKTSALSKRWSSVWTQTSSVSVSFWTEKFGYEAEFDFFDKFLLRCTSPAIRKLHLLRLRLDYRSGLKERVEGWIRFAVGRCVEDLRIQVDEGFDEEPYALPWELLRSKSLTRLRLVSCVFPSLSNGNSGTISWSSLKALTVHSTMMMDEVINGVLEGSPMLESLTLEGCYGMNSIRIFSKVMRELVISRYCDPFHDEDTCFCLEIDAPYLRSLRLLGWWQGKEAIVLRDLSSLVDVELDFNPDFNKRNSDIVYGSMMGILSKLSFVDKFVIGNGILKDLSYYKGNGEFSLQLKCRHLTLLAAADEYCLGGIAEVLECAPNVETLIMDFTNPRRSCKLTPTNANTSRNKFESWNGLTCCIKNIAIIGFPGCNGNEPPYWLSLVKLLLRDAQVLDKMIIDAICPWFYLAVSSEEVHAEYAIKVAEDILRFPRGSKTAQVRVKYPFIRGSPPLD